MFTRKDIDLRCGFKKMFNTKPHLKMEEKNKKQSSQQAVKETRKRTRRKFTAQE
jgi:hypothetical protein